MRFKVLFLIITLGLWGAASQNAAEGSPSVSAADAQRGKTATVTNSRDAGTNAGQTNVLRQRYAPISTMSSTLLLTVQDETSGEQTTIVVDHAYWQKFYAKSSKAVLTQGAYEEVMMDHLLNHKPFIVDSISYGQLKKCAAPEPDAELQALSMEAISQRFLRPIPRSHRYWTVKPGVKMDRAFIRLLLEKGCVLNSSCLDGSPLITW
ncbi:MAG: hypothetical protein Q4F00_08420 [bacterium]|nr:hypothetical protein [bacterium]